jgi:hypothetical protein
MKRFFKPGFIVAIVVAIGVALFYVVLNQTGCAPYSAGPEPPSIEQPPTAPAKELPELVAPGPEEPDAIPAFPWPPPQPSARLRLPRAPFAQARSLDDVANGLVDALWTANYGEYSFYSVPDGFAMVTRLEQINSDGSPAPEAFRFRPPSEPLPFSFARFLRELFFAPDGYYRLIVFIVTPHPFQASGNPLDEEAASDLLAEGANTLSSTLREQPFTADYSVDALIYEFQKQADAVTEVVPSLLGPRLHLVNSGLSRGLGLNGE